jgi:hypothetical protein
MNFTRGYLRQNCRTVGNVHTACSTGKRTTLRFLAGLRVGR